MLSFLRSLTSIGLPVLFHPHLFQSFVHDLWPVPKKVEGAFRLIHHLSYTKDSSLTRENNRISFDDTSVPHATVKDAIVKVCMLVKIVLM